MDDRGGAAAAVTLLNIARWRSCVMFDSQCDLAALVYEVVIVVPSHRFADWIRFADGMSVKLRCDRAALDAWWQTISARQAGLVRQDHQTVCEVFK
jgi:hypothetical protein